MAKDDKKPDNVAALIKTTGADPHQAYAKATTKGIYEAFRYDNPAGKLKMSATQAIKLRQGLFETDRDPKAPDKMTFSEEVAAASADPDNRVVNYNFRAGMITPEPINVVFDTGTGKFSVSRGDNKYEAKLTPVTAPIAPAPVASAPAPAPAPASAPAPAAAKPPKPPAASGVVTVEPAPAAAAPSGTDHSATIEANRARDAKARQAAKDLEQARIATDGKAMRYPPSIPSDKPAGPAPAAEAPVASVAPKPPKPGKKPAAGGSGERFDAQTAAAERFLITVGAAMASEPANSPRWHFHRLVKGIDGYKDKDLKQALEVFQELRGLPKTGTLDKATVVSMQEIMRDAGISNVGMPPVVSVDGKTVTMDQATIRATQSFAGITDFRLKVQSGAVPAPPPVTPADAEHARVQAILDTGAPGRPVNLPPEQEAAPAAGSTIVDAFRGAVDRLKPGAAAPVAPTEGGAVDIDAEPAAAGPDLTRLRQGAAELVDGGVAGAKKLGAKAEGVLGDLRKGFDGLLEAGKDKATGLAADLEERRKAWEAEQAKGKKGPRAEP
jgi:hypothetical protein